MFAIEVDGELGKASLRALCREGLDSEETLLSGAGNMVYAYFRWPRGLAVRNSGKKIAPGLSIRGEGDYVVIPPLTVHRIPHAYLNPNSAVGYAPQVVIDSAFEVMPLEYSEKILSFPKSSMQEAISPPSQVTRGKILPFHAHVSSPLGANANHKVFMYFERHDGGWRCLFFAGTQFGNLLLRELNLATSRAVWWCLQPREQSGA